jgi:hypothetical protein
MRRLRVALLALAPFAAMLASAPDAPALAHGGQGLYGETNFVDVTNAMFMTIAFFAVVVVVFSLIQGRLERRKHARLDAAKRRAANVDWRGGW